jgi:hypothetical protein
MAINVASWVKEACTTVGTGALILTGNADTFITFAAALNNGDSVYYAVQDANGNREAGIGTFDGVSSLARTTVTATLTYGSYNQTTPSAIVLSGDCQVICTLTANAFESLLTNIERATLDKQVIVKTASDFGVIDSTKEYFLDGIIDMTGASIEIPAGGIYIAGHNFDISGMVCTSDSYTLFTSPVGGSGNILFDNFHIDVSGAGSQVFDIVSNTGFDACEVDRVNYNNCSSLGTIDNYRQGLETGTGRFGGKPELTLKGVWVGGYFIETSIVRSLADGAYSLYKAGTGFQMNSRFRSNQNIDLPSLASFVDFAPANFPNPSTLQLTGMELTRNGAYVPDDTNLTPNITGAALPSAWVGNNGLVNTFVGGTLTATAEATTTINTQSVWEPLAAVWSTSGLQHFDSPSSGQARHLGNTPREYQVAANVVIESTQNISISLRFMKWDDSLSTATGLDDTVQTRVVNNLQGGRDVAYFTVIAGITLDQNDYIFLEVRNNTSTADVIAELSSFFRVQER